MAVAASFDAPTGRLDAIPSVGGGVLRYFTPDPLPDLLRRCQAWSRAQKKESTSEKSTAMAMLFARLAALRSRGMVDEPQARRLIALMFRRERIRKQADVFSLARDVCNPPSLRAEIIFSGGATSSSATHVFAPYPAVPSLIDSLVNGLTEEFEGLDTTTRAAALGFFCVHVHPFKDGNGRWTRLVILADAVPGAEFSAVLSAVFQVNCKEDLCNRIWPQARMAGLSRYLEAARKFENHVSIIASKRGLFEAAAQLDGELRKLLRPPTAYAAVASELWASGTVELGWIRANAGVSKKVMDGFVARTVGLGDGLFSVRGDRYFVDEMHQRIAEAVCTARDSTFKELE